MRDIKSWDKTTYQIMGTGGEYQALSGLTVVMSEAIDLGQSDRRNGWHGASIVLQAQYNGTPPVDNIIIKVFGSLDDVTYGEIFSFVSSSYYHSLQVGSGDPNPLTTEISGFPYMKIGVVQTGDTDTHEVKVYSRRWRIV